jgi:hypothetical protein
MADTYTAALAAFQGKRPGEIAKMLGLEPLPGLGAPIDQTGLTDPWQRSGKSLADVYNTAALQERLRVEMPQRVAASVVGVLGAIYDVREQNGATIGMDRYTVIEYLPGTLGEIPEGGIVDTLTYRRRSFTGTHKMEGVGFTVTAHSLLTPQGAAHFVRSLAQVADTVERSMVLLGLRAIEAAPTNGGTGAFVDAPNLGMVVPPGVRGAEGYLSHLREQWNVIGRGEIAFARALENIKREMVRRGGAATVALVPPGSAARLHFAGVNAQKALSEQNAPGMGPPVSPAAVVNGVQVCEVGGIPVGAAHLRPRPVAVHWGREVPDGHARLGCAEPRCRQAGCDRCPRADGQHGAVGQ